MKAGHSETRKSRQFDHWLVSAGRRIQSIGESGQALTWMKRFCGRLTISAVVGYLAATISLWVCCRWIGERNLTSAFLLFIPPSFWLLPVLILGPVAALFHRRSFIALFIGICITTYSWMNWRWPVSAKSAPTPNTITLLTYNRGQQGNNSIQPFKNLIHPDFMVVQDAPNRAQTYARSPDYKEFSHTLSCGEHTLLSRYPIVEVAPIEGSSSDRHIKAARFVVDWKGRRISIYSVHLQTPREMLQSQSKGAFLLGIFGVPGTPLAERRRQYQTFWDNQINDAKSILAVASTDPNPRIMAGDFNSPSLGYIHRMITKDWYDAHEEAGSGFGFTFPGVTRNPLSLGGPWMRIDYVFFGGDWDAVSCTTEPNRQSQHRAVAATLTLR